MLVSSASRAVFWAASCCCVSGKRVQFFNADDVQNVLPLAPKDYPEALQGILWMDQTGFYAHSDVPSGAPDAGLSFGDTASTLDTDTREIVVDVTGPAWQWFNNKQAYLMCRALLTSKFRYRFKFSDDYSHAEIIPEMGYYVDADVPQAFTRFTMDLQPAYKDPDVCPPADDASKEDIGKCAKWKRHSTAAGGLSPDVIYYAFEIVDGDGNPVQPYYDKYLEWVAHNKAPSQTLARTAFLVWDSSEGPLDGADTFRGAPFEMCIDDTDGSCHLLACHSWRGPTDCVSGHCICQEGYSADGSGVCHSDCHRHCADDTGGTCNLLNCFSWRGPTKCVSGHCICQKGSCADGSGVCQSDDSENIVRAKTREVGAQSVFAAGFLAAVAAAVAASRLKGWKGDVSSSATTADARYVSIPDTVEG